VTAPTQFRTRLARSRTARALAGYTLLYLSWMVLRWGPADHRVLGDLFLTVLNLWVVVLLWGAAHRCRAVSALKWSWRLMALAAVAYIAGNVAQFAYEVLLGRMPYPSIDDVFFLSTYVFIFAGLLRYPTPRSSGVQRVQTLLDASVLAIGGGVVVWFAYLGPTLSQVSRTHLLQSVFSVLYPVGDLIVIAGLASVVNRGSLRSSRGVLGMYAVGTALFITADLLDGYITVKLGGTYRGGDWLDPLWFCGLAFGGLAASLQPAPSPGELAELGRSFVVRRRPSWLPHLGLGVALGLLIYVERGRSFYPVLGIIFAIAIADLLVAIRQFLAQHELIAVQHQLQRAHDELATLAITDALTELPNHRALVAAIEREVEHASRYGAPLALAFFDVDYFKAVNDTFGHGAGDAALREFGGLITACLRSVDSVGRWGGEEFVAVMPGIDRVGAVAAAERVRLAIAEHRFEATGGGHLSCSIGVATLGEDGIDRDGLLASADRSMYAAKRLGRDRTATTSDLRSGTRVA
jgi:diguanylate cyclase (GGDEF)-like protein